ncbi:MULTISPECIES: ketopantoate reductase family protein [Paraburkholderia]|uniref:ketopantoate reductase family protein n=1 Tax=Paraburkholderia TaxID=1822464 RepID=UPI00039B8E01|nr:MULTISPECIES: 2-dehydropantoate 2-reductase [Paraburkholderia]MDH6146428.1 2-dehydropantoate 2-reductase [Paraburkholderia sp. WSM4179]MDH6147080.1 2-dehydropantoate 2-reductase [Paraburkholderia sp. WSM4179]
MAKVAIVGSGAMGSVYAGLMVSAGHEVHAICLWPDHVAAMQEKGLRVEGASGDRTVPIHASTTTDGIGECDLVIIATKAFDVEDAARASEQLLGPKTVVQTIQNGLGSAEKAATILGENRIAVGVVGGFGASIRAPGHAHHNGMEMIRFGAYRGLSRDDLEASAEIWRSSGFKVAIFEDLDQMVWEKLIMNVAFSGTTCATGMTIGEVMANPSAWSVAKGAAEEAIAVAKAAGIRLDVGDPIEHIRKLGRKIPNARPSMLLDYNLGRRGEVEAINGSISREGRKYGVPTPVNDTVVAIIKAREANFTE